MISRLDAFIDLEKDVWHGRNFARLTREEQALAVAFISNHASLPVDLFEKSVNRLFLDLVEKPKNWAIIQELLCAANKISFNSFPKSESGGPV